MTENSNSDLRRFPRFQKSMLVRINNGNVYSGRTIDVSENGAKMTISRPVAIGERLNLELYFQDDDPFPIRLVGECRWSESSEIDETVVGMDLTPSHSRSLAVLRDYISSRER